MIDGCNETLTWKRECQKMNPDFEKNLPEEGFDTELDEWLEY